MIVAFFKKKHIYHYNFKDNDALLLTILQNCCLISYNDVIDCLKMLFHGTQEVADATVED